MGVSPVARQLKCLSWLRGVFDRKNLKRAAIALAMLMLVAWLCRNSIARQLSIRIGSRLLATRVEIASIDIQWDAISIAGVEVFEPNIPDAKQLSVQQIQLVPSVWSGFQTGVWLSQISIDAPTSEVRFDQNGQLISVFPEGGGESESTGPLKIPIAKLVVNDASLIVHQIGKQPLRVAGVDVDIKAGERIQATVSVPDLLGSQCVVNCDLDAQSFEGASVLAVENVRLDSSRLAQLPLVPTSVDAEPFSIDCGMTIDIQHPANELDFLQHDLQVHAWSANAIVDRLGVICERLDMVVGNEGGNLTATLNANPLQGDWRLSGSVDMMASTPELIIESSVTGCQADTLSHVIADLKKLQTNATALTRWSLVLDDKRLRFDGQASVDITASSFDKLSLPDVNATVTANGSVLLSDPTSLDGELFGSITSDSFDLSTLAESLQLPSTQGHVIVRSEFAIPLESVADLDSYTGIALVETASVGTADLRMDDVTLAARLAERIVVIDLGNCIVRDNEDYLLAELKSNTSIELKDGGQVRSTSEIFAEPSIELARLLGVNTLDPGGRVLAQLNASCPTNDVASPDQWLAETRVQTQSLSAIGETISDVDWRATLDGGTIQCSPLEASWRGHTLIANASGRIGSSLAIRGDFSLDSLRLNEVSEVMSRYSATRLSLDGLATVDGSFALATDLTTGNRSLQASGLANLTQSSYAQTRIGEARVQWSADLGGLDLTTSSADFLGGRFDVSAEMKELDWTRTQVEGNFSGVEAARLVGVAGQNLPTTGTIDGGFRVTSIASVESLTGEAWVNTNQLSVSRLPLQIDLGRMTVNQGQLSINASGTAVDGTFVAQAGGSLPQLARFFEQDAPPIAEIPLVADIQLTGLRTQSLVRPLRLPREAQAVSARISANCSRTVASWDGRHLCLASATIEDLRYNHQGLSQRMSLETVIHANRLELSGIRGRFADGALKGSGEVNFSRSPTGRFDVSASHVNLRRATSPLGVNDVSGTGTLRVRGRIGPVISGQLDASIDNLTAAGVAVRKAKFPVDWSFRRSSNLARWQCRAGTVSVGGGNVRIASEGSFSRGLSATTSVRIENVDLAKLMQNGSAGSGTLSGTALVRAKNARAADDLVGNFAMEIKNIQAMQIPVLDQLPKMVTLSPPVPGRGQDGGTVRGRIAGGLVHLDEVAIYQSNVQVMVTGNATMAGKLNLDVVASTESTSPTDQLISLLDSPVMLAAPAPVALVVKANELLKDRVVRVHVGGTAGRPTLRLQPGKQLSQDAVRFFLSSSLGPAADRLSEIQSKNRQR